MPDTKTIVVFRKWPAGQVLALFPQLKEKGAGMCLSYEHVGQHSGADFVGCMHATTAATPEEYAALKRELERIGYVLEVRDGTRPTGRKPTVSDINAANPERKFFTQNNLRFAGQTMKSFSVYWNETFAAWETVAVRTRPAESSAAKRIPCGESRHLWDAETLKYLHSTPV